MNRHRSIVGLFAVSTIAAFVAANVVCFSQNGEEPKSAKTRKFNPRTVLKKPIRAIRDATFVEAGKVTDQVKDNDLVLGVVINGEARAYPINMLTGPSREIINDTLGGSAIAATW